MKTAMYSKSSVFARLVALIAIFMFAQTAWAIDLDSAKARGLVGEANNGYLAAVETPASSDVRRLINTVNEKRREKFVATARKTDATLAQVQMRFYQLAVRNTKPGNYYQDASGNWKKK